MEGQGVDGNGGGSGERERKCGRGWNVGGVLGTLVEAQMTEEATNQCGFRVETEFSS